MSSSLVAFTLIACRSYLPDSADAFVNELYSDQLRAAKEPRLGPTGDLHREVYRFTWVPSFHPTISVRVEQNRGTFELVGKRLTGQGGYEPGRIAEEVKRAISEEEWRTVREHLDAAGFWEMPSEEPPQFTQDGGVIVRADGAGWLLEGADATRYHFVDRTFHESYPDFEAACLCLLALSGFEPDELASYGVELPLARGCSRPPRGSLPLERQPGLANGSRDGG